MSVQPRKIAWLIYNNDWSLLEKVIKYNCSIIGGYYNIIITLEDNLQIGQRDSDYIISYDPDLVILPPNITCNALSIEGINPFCFVEWIDLQHFVNYSRDGMSETESVRVDEGLFASEKYSLQNAVIAVSADNNTDYNRLALMACGEMFYSEEVDYKKYEEIEKSYFGYREEFLKNFVLNPDELVNKENSKEPDRFFLNTVINRKNKFPIDDSIAAIDMCLRIQSKLINRYTFCNLTRNYNYNQKYDIRNNPFVIIVSDSFDIDEAILFWNLRASGRFVSWISFKDLEKHLKKFTTLIIKVVNDFMGAYTDLYNRGLNLICEEKYSQKLNVINEKITSILEKQGYDDFVVNKVYRDFKLFDYEIPSIKEIRVLIDDNRISFNEKYSDFGTYTVKLLSYDYMFPYNKNIEPLINSDSFSLYRKAFQVPYIRISNDNLITIQLSDEIQNITLKKPNINEIFDKIFSDKYYGKLVLSSTGRYHKKYIELCHGFQDAIKYLKTEPYIQILELLSSSNESRGEKIGWFLEHLNRKVINIFEIFKLLKKELPKNFNEVYKMIDSLPEEIYELHQKGILEKGFVLKCKECAYQYWYYVDEVGQKYKCNRCGSEQHYDINPLWSYKLNEIVYQGLKSDMVVPLLTIDYLEKRSEHNFKWLIDSDFSDTKRNLDIICSIDGKVYIGEAKSCNYIEKNQFEFYTELCKNVPIDGIVFATSEKKWDAKTERFINELREVFCGDVIVLTYDDLYNQVIEAKQNSAELINEIFGDASLSI